MSANPCSASARSGVACTVAALLLAGCASSEVTSRQDSFRAPIDRPDRIIVYDFAATPQDIPDFVRESTTYAEPETPQTAEEIAAGRRLGAQTSQELVARIRSMGLNAQRASSTGPAGVGDVLIVGELLSVEEGARGKRVLIGFGAGGSELSFQMRGYLNTQNGPWWLGSREVESSGGKVPGAVVPILARSPVGLVANSALKLKGERGSETLTAAATRSAESLAEELREVFERNQWL